MEVQAKVPTSDVVSGAVLRVKMPTKKPKSAGKKKPKNIKPPSPPPIEEPDHPEEIYPLCLTSVTQELFGCLADEDVTSESPYKLLKKADIIQDIKTRASVSDFSPAKQKVLDYPDDEILLVFDREFTYGQCFYLVVSPEHKELLLTPPQPEEEPEVIECEVNKTPEPKEWISLGSEVEIENESVKETREKLGFTLRLHRRIRAPVCFSDRNAADDKHGNLGCPSYEDSRFSIKWIQRDCGIQAASTLQSSSAQTQWKCRKNMCSQYKPREFSEEEKDNILQSERMKDFCNSVVQRMLVALQQEEIMNVFHDDWRALGTGPEDSDWSGTDCAELMLYQSFTDQKYSKDKKISCINWHPTIYGVIAVAFTAKKEQRSKEPTSTDVRPSHIVFFCFSNPYDPKLLLECPDDIYAFQFCPSDPNIIVGGCRNGQVVLWDISGHVTHLQRAQSSGKKVSANTDTFELDDNKESKTPVVRLCAVSAVESSHKAPITDVQWLPPTFEVTRMGIPVENKYKTSVQVVTCSPDCSIMFWDVRLPKLLNQPASVKKQTPDQKAQMTQYSVPDTFKHLDRTWKPLCRILLPNINTSGDYAPLKFNFQHYTCSGNTDRNTEEADEDDESSEIPRDFSQLRLPSAKNLPTLEDVNTKLYIGTEDGEIVYTDWKLDKDESGRMHSTKPLNCFSIHSWLVNTIPRSPFFQDVILTTGGWKFAIWQEGVMDGPIIVSPSSERSCTVGCWSLTRPAVFFIGKDDGSIEVWNLLEKASEPIQVHAHVTTAKITSITPWIASSKQHFLAVTDEFGVVHVFEIPKKLCIPSKNESSNLKKYFELEKTRLDDYLRRETLWEAEQKEAKDLTNQMPKQPPKAPQKAVDTHSKEYKEYLALEESIMKTDTQEA